ncbi:3-deoxy-D-manno-octulosonic acid transferase [Roseivivax sp. CAU 1761]
MSRRAFSMQAYLALARNRAAGAVAWTPPEGQTPRRPGGCLWIHGDDRLHSRSLAALAARLLQQRPELTVVRTGEWDGAQGTVALPQETMSDARRFLEAMTPDVCLWAGRQLRPALIAAARRQGVTLILADPGTGPLDSPAPRWLPDSVPATLQFFDHVFLPDAEAERRLARASLPAERVSLVGRLTETTLPLDCSETLLSRLLGDLAARPVWLGARTRGIEAAYVIEAHRRATRYAHRLLLVLVPQGPEDAEEARRAAEESGLRFCNWDAGDSFDEFTQILLCEGPEELGLWYRLAPLAFLGGSLVSGFGGTDPLEAAALGTAILYGPNVGQHLDAYTTLVGAGAARIVRDVDTLAGAVSQLVAPDRAAAMAHAGWDVVSQGAAATDPVIAKIAESFDARARAERA